MMRAAFGLWSGAGRVILPPGPAFPGKKRDMPAWQIAFCYACALITLVVAIIVITQSGPPHN